MSIRFVAAFGFWAILGASAVLAEAPYQVTSFRQLGMNIPWAQSTVSMARDAAGNTLVTGTTWDSLDGPQQGLGDVFLRKYDAAGLLQWTRQFGTNKYDESFSVSLDSSGNAFVTGRTRGNLGGANQGDFDIFLSKFDTSGSQLWTQQLGSGSYDYSYSVAVDSAGNAIVAGETGGSLGGSNKGAQDPFVLKYDPSGTLLWKNQPGTAGTDAANAVCIDATGNAIIAGTTGGPLSPPQFGSFDAFVAKYANNGALQWAKQLGTSQFDRGYAVAVDSHGNTYVTGSTTNINYAPHSKPGTIFISKYDVSGTLLWSKQLGDSTKINEGLCLAVDSSDNVFLSGYTNDSLGGPNLGGADVFVMKYDTLGALLWSEQLGTSGNDLCSSLVVDAAGNLYLGGTNTTTPQQKDAFWYTLSPVPEPGSIALLLAGVICPLAYAWQRRKRST